MCDEEESMELSGESNLVSNLHNFSFDVSWSTFSHDPSPPVQRKTEMWSPARLAHCSTPHQRHWKTLSLDQHHREPQNPTVKISQKANTQYLEDKRRESFSPMELDHPELHYGHEEVSAGLRKRHSMDTVYERQLTESPVRTAEDLSQCRESKANDLSLIKPLNHNNNIKGDFDLDDSVFVTESFRSGVETKNRGGKSEGVGLEKKSSVFVLLLVVLVSGCIGVYLYLQVDSCAVFDIDVVKLRHKLEDNVFGQHIAVKAVIDALTVFEKEVKAGSRKRTLSLAFHGWTGVGKNYISRFISEAFYNARVSLYLIPLHFPHVDTSDGVVQGWITGNITKCGVNVLIFDEIDKASKPLLLEILTAMESVQNTGTGLDDPSTSPIIVSIFISNSKSNQINQFLFSQLVNDRERELIRLQEFEGIFEKSSHEWYEDLKSKNLIDFFVPFFPLAESHVKQCIIKEFIKRGRDPENEMVIAVMNELSFFEMGGHNGQMSLTGCKRVPDKVDLHIDD